MSGEVRITDPETGGQKGQKPERYDLFPFDALDEVARVYGEGAKKYEDDNWLKGYRWRLSFGALLRHVSKALQGEDVDPETGCLHLAHAAWHCLTLITFKKRGLGTDDRKPPERASHVYSGEVTLSINGAAWKTVADSIKVTSSSVVDLDEPIPYALTLQVGARARVTSGESSGSIVTVIGNDGEDEENWPWSVEFADRGICYYGSSELEVFNGTFKPGDKVTTKELGECVVVPNPYDGVASNFVRVRSLNDSSFGMCKPEELEPS